MKYFSQLRFHLIIHWFQQIAKTMIKNNQTYKKKLITPSLNKQKAKLLRIKETNLKRSIKKSLLTNNKTQNSLLKMKRLAIQK